ADVLRATCAVNQSGLSVSIDNLGENVSNAEEARASAHPYRQLLDEISARKLNANISLKLTHMGLDVNENLARELAGGLVAKAASSNPRNFVRVDMEGSAYTQRTLDFVYELHRIPGNQGCVGAVIQSYMRRAESDIEKLRSEEHTSELQSLRHLVCRLLLEKKKQLQENDPTSIQDRQGYVHPVA